MRCSPAPVHWKPHFSSTRRDAGLVTRAVYRKFKLSRLALRQLASLGALPGVVKSSW